MLPDITHILGTARTSGPLFEKYTCQPKTAKFIFGSWVIVSFYCCYGERALVGTTDMIQE